MKKFNKHFWALIISLFLGLSVSSQAHTAETLKADVVVIGSGASGLVAALTAAEGGARVIVFEKLFYPGGTSNYPGVSSPLKVKCNAEEISP